MPQETPIQTPMAAAAPTMMTTRMATMTPALSMYTDGSITCTQPQTSDVASMPPQPGNVVAPVDLSSHNANTHTHTQSFKLNDPRLKHCPHLKHATKTQYVAVVSSAANNIKHWFQQTIHFPHISNTRHHKTPSKI